jgi:hypothetical protein
MFLDGRYLNKFLIRQRKLYFSLIFNPKYLVSLFVIGLRFFYPFYVICVWDIFDVL